MTPMNFYIRPASPLDQQFLWEMLYQSLYVPAGEVLPRNVVTLPEIAKYVKEWGHQGDLGFIAIDLNHNIPIGAAWLRLFTKDDQGYGYVDDQTPKLGFAVLPEYRGRGVGTVLTHLLQKASTQYKSVSLSVSPDNPALRLYERMEFQQLDVNDTTVTMLKSLRP